MVVGKIVLSAAALSLFCGSVALAQSAGSIDRQFSSAVARVLDSVKGQEEFLGKLSDKEYRAFVSCAQGVMNGAPLARKQYVLAAGSAGEMRARFDEVALDNRAALKQQITRDCA